MSANPALNAGLVAEMVVAAAAVCGVTPEQVMDPRLKGCGHPQIIRARRAVLLALPDMKQAMRLGAGLKWWGSPGSVQATLYVSRDRGEYDSPACMAVRAVLAPVLTATANAAVQNDALARRAIDTVRASTRGPGSAPVRTRASRAPAPAAPSLATGLGRRLPGGGVGPAGDDLERRARRFVRAMRAKSPHLSLAVIAVALGQQLKAVAGSDWLRDALGEG
ncbi:hypothetical protein [Marinicauda sp. Alg238-R41]|uniref:hypothetical protein n=1 Tax=Marinicauda sp. Alg238-R41 TaxID=2993447 RepID=UPI0022E3FDBC|nr:hypothetical protein [Marinicauda sp. Alg238-R41]